jgi:hypothetical protein
VIAASTRGRKGFENSIIVVMTIVSPILTKMAFTLRLILPGMSGAKTTTTGRAYLK